MNETPEFAKMTDAEIHSATNKLMRDIPLLNKVFAAGQAAGWTRERTLNVMLLYMVTLFKQANDALLSREF